MNARVDLPLASAEVAQLPLRLALQEIINSSLFARAPRTCKLLSFLVEKMLEHKEDEITEHAIGLAVFRRDGRSYDTALDPVVRVQMGRLRARLAAYDATHLHADMRLTVPLGSYVPVFTARHAAPAPALQRPLQVAPLRNLAGADASQAFVSGVDEELGTQLFHTFGSLVQLPSDDSPAANVRHRLEGSIRVERNHVRASMRLVDTRAGAIAWLSQFDCNGELDMSLQEQLATAICARLQTYLQTASAA